MGEAAETESTVDAIGEVGEDTSALPDMNEESADILSLSDSDLNDYLNNVGDNSDGETTDDDESMVDAEETGTSDSSGDNDDESESEDGEHEEGELDSKDESEDNDDDSDDNGTSTSDSDDSDEEDSDKKDEKQNDDINYEAEYKKILAPFKANGKNIQVDNVDDAITLMQMGANYNKRMASLKPNLKIVKMLQQNDLLDEHKLSHLIDISNKDPEAIAKFLKDSEIDPMDLNTETSDTYKPKDHRVNDLEIELDQAIDSIKENESYPKTIDTISNQWDEQSREIILSDPKIIPVIDQHVQTGIFDKIVTEMEKERTLGRLDGVSDIHAYKLIGDRLMKAGKLLPNQETSNVSQQKADETKKAEVVRNKKRKAAATTKTTTTKKVDKTEFDPLGMSDEEFAKLSVDGLYT